MNTAKQTFLITALLAVVPMSFSNIMPMRKVQEMPTMEDLALPHCKLTNANRDSLKGKLSEDLEMLFTAIKNEWGIPQGLTFHGQRGVGKTLSAQALAGELDGYTMHFDAGDLLYQGNCRSKIKRIFKHARDCVEIHHKYIIIFIDNIHKIGKKNYQSSDMREFISTLSDEIMKEDENTKILVIAATYEPGEEIDNFFTKEPFQAVEFTIPDKESRLAILMHYFEQSSCFDKELHAPMLDNLATLTYDFTPRDLKGLVTKAKSSLGQRHKDSKDMTQHKFTQKDFDSARKSTNTMKVKEDGSFSWTRVAEGSVVATVGAAAGFVIAIIAGSNGGNGGSPTGPSGV
ncbi:AAA family ATPase [Candidatus Dependentiae bacterium]|nr:AAA family ATPase [Candidatus Dependentiae bacterium]